MKLLYFDPIVGASGDMILAALIDCGVPVAYLKKKLAFVPGCSLTVRRVQKNGVTARRVRFVINKKITEDAFIPLINKSRLSPKIRQTATMILNRIFAVEKKVHRAKHLHLHELADADTLLDITGTVIAIDHLGIDRVFSRPLKAGQGFIKTVEGTMPAFNFATAELLKKFPVEFLPAQEELTTPTGAAIISSLATPAEHLFMTSITRIGLGAGSMNIQDYPNLMRIFVGESSTTTQDECAVIETNIDDMNPQDYDAVITHLYDAGALEVFLTPTIMKKTRPAVLLTVLCSPDKITHLASILFKETTTLGVRTTQTTRLILPRTIKSISSPYGRIRVKIHRNNPARFSLEYEDLKKLAKKHDVAINTLRKELHAIVKTMLAKASS
ncbi:MAG: nickel pincer cofactor biosynthesis protein LarC [candidate division WOR-3 bacterium]|nr:MAG: nickel pincer cofactor biosynthesis protein LarC [candidate division WOR-3 bacterium]